MPRGEEWRIEQGYLQPDASQPLQEGRLRRVTHASGEQTHVHTVKRGVGRVREETERTITAQEFAAAWPRTEGRRLSKLRTRVREGALVWEVDQFDGLPLVLAECELPERDTALSIPGWLAPHIEREVTEEPAFRNYELALRASRAPPRGQ
ncbi:MAG: adenylate cyclase [Phycisphaerae bacterium]|nr:adenylate cyclase [Phycisphaerae bacterium]